MILQIIVLANIKFTTVSTDKQSKPEQQQDK